MRHRARLETRGPSATVPDLVAALTAVRELSAQTGSMGLTDSAKYEIEPRLRLKEEQLQDALVLAQALRIDATANDGLVVPGQRVGVSVVVGNRGAGELGVAKVTLLGFRRARCVCRRRGDAERAVPMRFGRQHAGRRAADGRLLAATRERRTRHVRRGCAVWAAIPAVAVPRARRDDIGGRAHRSRAAGAVSATKAPGLVGEKRMELNVVPAFAVSVSPQIVVVPRKPARARPDRQPAASCA